MKKITMQIIADALNISRVTVWKVFNGQPGVSEITRKRVFAKAEELGYQKNRTFLPAGPHAAYQGPEGFESNGHAGYSDDDAMEAVPFEIPTTVSVVVSRPDSSLFWLNIIHQIAKDLSKYKISLLYTYLPSYISEDYKLPPTLTDGSVGGMIVLNIYDSSLYRLLADLELPKVFFDTHTQIPPERLNGDLLLTEGEQTIYLITAKMIESGRKSIGFLGDVSYARTNLDRYHGFLRAMEEHRLPLRPELCMTAPIGLHTYGEEIHHFLQKLPSLPSALICVSDYVAHFVYQYLTERMVKIPEEVALTGFDGRFELLDSPELLTTVPIDTRVLGKRLVRQLLYRMKYPDFPYETSYLRFPVVYGASTDF